MPHEANVCAYEKTRQTIIYGEGIAAKSVVYASSVMTPVVAADPPVRVDLFLRLTINDPRPIVRMTARVQRGRGCDRCNI